jgi:8-oxo-dGTP diphosphatase
VINPPLRAYRQGRPFGKDGRKLQDFNLAARRGLDISYGVDEKSSDARNLIVISVVRMARKQFHYDYPMPAVTADVVAISRKRPLRVLLIRRKKPPFKGRWAIPGGFVEINEDLEAGARREFLEETGIRAGKLEQVHAFGDPKRDPRGRTISVVFVARLDSARIQPQAGDDAKAVAWHPLSDLPPLAFDHHEILTFIRRWLRNRL